MTTEAFKIEATTRAARRIRDYLKTIIKSQTLRDSMHVATTETGEAAVVWPQYWAVYYNDGRGPVRPVNGKFLVWFVDPDEDPRLASGYPVRATDIKRLALSPEEFQALLESGKMIVTTQSGAVKGARFVERAGKRAANLAKPEIRDAFRKHVRDDLGDLLRIRDEWRV